MGGEGGGGGGAGQGVPSGLVYTTKPAVVFQKGPGMEPHMLFVDRMRRVSAVIPRGHAAGMVEVRRLLDRSSCRRLDRALHA